MTTTCTRYLSTVQGLKHLHGWKTIADWLRLAALPSLVREDDGVHLATAIEHAAYELRHHAGWSPDLATTAQWPAAGIAVGLGLEPRHFAYACETVRKRLSEAGLPDAGSWAPAVVACLHQWPELWPLTPTSINALVNQFAGLKAKHNWLTGPDDLAVCAALVGTGGVVSDAVANMEVGLAEVYPWAANDLQAAASLMGLADVDPVAALERFRGLVAAMIALRSQVWTQDPAAVALLVVAGVDAERIAADVLNVHAQVAALAPEPDPALAFAVAVGIAIADLPDFRADTLAGRRLRAALTVVVARIGHRLAALDLAA
jgi:hypothetical protein